MFKVSIVCLMILSLAIFFKAASSKNNNPKNLIGPLIAPIFAYFMLILITRDSNGYFVNYIDQQLLTLSIGFYAIYTMMIIFVLRKVVQSIK